MTSYTSQQGRSVTPTCTMENPRPEGIQPWADQTSGLLLPRPALTTQPAGPIPAVSWTPGQEHHTSPVMELTGSE